MKPNLPATLRIAALLGLLGASTVLAFEAGGYAYTKRVETNVLPEPRALATPSGHLGFRRQVKVDQVKGNWLHISDPPVTGWVFAGNLAAEMPPEIKGTDGLPLTASQTTASAAARPLTPAANDYAVRRNLGQARVDLDWLQNQCRNITNVQVDAYLRAQRKGEYQ